MARERLRYHPTITIGNPAYECGIIHIFVCDSVEAAPAVHRRQSPLPVVVSVSIYSLPSCGASSKTSSVQSDLHINEDAYIPCIDKWAGTETSYIVLPFFV